MISPAHLRGSGFRSLSFLQSYKLYTSAELVFLCSAVENKPVNIKSKHF